jgi:hypothetical protein
MDLDLLELRDNIRAVTAGIPAIFTGTLCVTNGLGYDPGLACDRPGIDVHRPKRAVVLIDHQFKVNQNLSPLG